MSESPDSEPQYSVHIRPGKDFGIFLMNVFHLTRLLSGILGMLVVSIVAGGAAISYIEGIRFSEGLYFTFVTALTIGFGDIAPVTPAGRVLTIAVGFIGLIFTGLIVAVATRALALTIEDVKRRRDVSD